MKDTKRTKRIRRRKRTRTKVHGTASMPRVTVFRSNRHILAQIIDDTTGKTLASVNDKPAKGAKLAKNNKTERATQVGNKLAAIAKKAKITKVVFDRGGYKYHGRVKALAEALRKGDLKL
jgi:large subunit ribosomal protein L18